MKLLFIHHSGALGGAGVSLLAYVKELAKQHRISLYLPDEPADMLEMAKAQCSGLPVDIRGYGRRIGAITYYSGGDSAFSPRFCYRAGLVLKQWGYWNRIVENERPDVAIVNSKVLSWMGWLPAMKRIKSICFVRETIRGSQSFPINRIVRSGLEGFSCVVFISRHDAAMERLAKAKPVVIRNFPDSSMLGSGISTGDACRRLRLDEGKFKALYVGGVSEMKGFDLAVQAALKAGVELIAAGNDFEDAMKLKSRNAREYSLHWKAFLERNDREGLVHVVGRQKDMAACYMACDVLLFPMRAPHQARPAFEAGYFGKPVIISDFENIREDVMDGENGFLVTPNDSDAIASRLVALRDSPELCARMGECNRQFSHREHSLEASSAAMERLLEELVGK